MLRFREGDVARVTVVNRLPDETTSIHWHGILLPANMDGVPGMSLGDTREYLQYVADTRLALLGYSAEFGSKNPFSFMELQDVQGLSNFFERTVSSYQTGIEGDVSFDEDF